MVFRKGKAGSGEVIPSSNQRRQSTSIPGELSRDGLRVPPSQLGLAIALALAGPQVPVQDTHLSSSPEQEDQQEESTAAQGDGSEHVLDTVTVLGGQEEEKKIGNTAGANKEDIERRGASHMSDLIDQISGTSVNSLYARPEISVGVQGIAGHGRMAQSLEGINQNFHAVTRDISQTGSIFVDPLKSIDVTRGGSTGTGALGSLGISVDFKYLDLEDVLLKGNYFGGMVRGSTGFSKYANGEKPSGSFFLGGRNERWDWMLGVAQSENDSYRIGSNFINRGDMLRDAQASNVKFYGNAANAYAGADSNCRYRGTSRWGQGSALDNCKFTPFQLNALKAAASEPLKGTQKKNDAQMLRLRHYFNDTYNQRVEFFATASGVKYETDTQPAIRVPFGADADQHAHWDDYPWSIRTDLESRVVNLKYGGNFNDRSNPEAQVYHETQDRKQRWTSYPGNLSEGKPLHYFVDIGSTGLKFNNASHFYADFFGPLRLDAGLKLRRANKKVDSMSDNEYYEQHMHSIGNTSYRGERWNPDSRNDVFGLALALSTEGDGPWQASAGVGWQRVRMDVINPRLMSGNVKRSGTMLNHYNGYYDEYRRQGIPRRQAQQMARERAAVDDARQREDFYIDPNSAFFSDASRMVEEKQKHQWDIKSAQFTLSYSFPDTGVTTYAQVGYSERAPTSNEMYISGTWLKTAFATNPDLSPEKNLSLNLGVNYQAKEWLTKDDKFDAGINYYRNRIRNYISYGPIHRADQRINEFNIDGNVANVNSLNDFVRHGLEINLAYSKLLFYIRGNLTLPIRHDNKMCLHESPSGRSYVGETFEDGSTRYTPHGKGAVNCYSGWNWMEVGAIEPIRGSLTAALTPYQGQLELGGTLSFRGKQRATFWYNPSRLHNQINENEGRSNGQLPDHACEEREDTMSLQSEISAWRDDYNNSSIISANGPSYLGFLLATDGSYHQGSGIYKQPPAAELSHEIPDFKWYAEQGLTSGDGAKYLLHSENGFSWDTKPGYNPTSDTGASPASTTLTTFRAVDPLPVVKNFDVAVNCVAANTFGVANGNAAIAASDFVSKGLLSNVHYYDKVTLNSAVIYDLAFDIKDTSVFEFVLDKYLGIARLGYHRFVRGHPDGSGRNRRFDQLLRPSQRLCHRRRLSPQHWRKLQRPKSKATSCWPRKQPFQKVKRSGTGGARW